MISYLSCYVTIFSFITSAAFDTVPRIKISRPPLALRETSTSVKNSHDPPSTGEPEASPPPPRCHHTAMRTRDIETCIEFYSLLGFQIETKFRAGPARAAWLFFRPPYGRDGDEDDENDERSPATPRSDGASFRLELIEVPKHVLQEPEGRKARAFDLLSRESLLGWNHVALDVTESIRYISRQQRSEGGTEKYGLDEWMNDLNKKSVRTFGKTLRIALEPYKKLIGNGVYELAFLYDADGCLVELLNFQSYLEQDVDSGWEPLDDEDVRIV